ncbi:hypothetical protein QQS21_005022 [Conoideocrella luteorostrata]|uniref:Restriction of telomere capping protein 4 n=1 Tax=Conoideocrella luteorostrata TaxID=1105319 RepID=A0AAJ0FZD4_9HYPO|nr:hypothetical protein QQS21_005022 [Conoideocrella luteorostrata]
MPLLNNQAKSRTAGRRVGLSNRQRAPPLLTTIGGSSTAKPSKKIKIPESIDDPPVSSDEEADSTLFGDKTPEETTAPHKPITISKRPGKSPPKKSNARRIPQREAVDSSSSGDELAARGDIKGTTFSRVKGTGTVRREFRNKRNESPIETKPDLNNENTKRQRIGDARPGKRRTEPTVTPPTSSGDHLRDEQGFTKVRKSKRTYKKKDSSSQEQPNVKNENKGNSKKIKIPDWLESPEKPKTNKLRVPVDAVSSSTPVKRRAKLKVPEIGDSGSEASLKFPISFDSLQAPISSRERKRLRKPQKIERTPSPPPAVFKMPASLSTLELRMAKNASADLKPGDGLSSSEDSAHEEAKLAMKDDVDEAIPATACPWCGEVVDKKLLDEFSKGKRMNVRLQTRFCQKHKKKTAEEEWRQRKYPLIDWDSLDTRFALYNGLLLDIINGSTSHFRSIHEKNIESGKARSIKKEGNMNPGYYGPRGSNLMCDYLVNVFGNLLKTKAVDDRVIAGRGSAAFIQNVLVAELAVQLIMEDMSASEEDARAILEESKALGEVVHEDA